MATTTAPVAEPATLPWWRHLYAQVLAGIALGVLVGALAPETGAALKPLGDAFIKLVKMIVAPVIFLTIVTGIAGMESKGALGRVAGKAFAYFLTVSTLALVVGLIVGNIVRPGAGLHIDPATLDTSGIADYTSKDAAPTITAFLLDIVPSTLLAPLAGGTLLQVLFVAILTGLALAGAGPRGAPVLALAESALQLVYRLVALLMRAAPIGAFGAMAFTIGKFGLGALASLAGLMATFYLTAFLFVALILGGIARASGFSLWRLLVYLRGELLLVLGTSSSETALPGLMEKLEAAGAAKPVVGLVVPTGYSFNLDGTNIYMTMAALFIANACDIELSLGEQLTLLGVAMLASKGAAGITGAGFVTLAATLSIVPTIPIAGMALLLGIDRLMSECRSLTNFIGNAVATLVVARWEGALDRDQLARTLSGAARAASSPPA